MAAASKTSLNIWILLVSVGLTFGSTQNCTGFYCNSSAKCIDFSLVCNNQSDCMNNEDEPEECNVCIGDTVNNIQYFHFKYHSYDTVNKGFIYNNSINDFMLYPYSNGFNKYIISRNFNVSSWPFPLFSCSVSNNTFKVQNCMYWQSWNDWRTLSSMYVDIGCKGCAQDRYICNLSNICIDLDLICNSFTDCILEDDETEFCEYCLILINITNDAYLYLNNQYKYYGHNDIWNGAEYFDGESLYLYPVISWHAASNYWLYQYYIGKVLNSDEWGNVFASCVIGHSSTILKYYTMQPHLCDMWYVYNQERLLLEGPINVSTNCADIHTINPTVSPSTAIYNATLHPLNNATFIGEGVRVNYSTIEFYTSDNGIDGSKCGSRESPCGTLSYAVGSAISVTKRIQELTTIIIMIRGQNETIIEEYNRKYEENLCFAYIQLEVWKNTDYKLTFDSITFTFDEEYISSTQDAFPQSTNRALCNYNVPDSMFYVSAPYSLSYVQGVFNFTLVINNLPVTDWTITQTKAKPFHIAQLQDESENLNAKFIFNKLIFKRNRIEHIQGKGLIVAPQIEIYNSIFANNILNGTAAALISTDILLYSRHSGSAKWSLDTKQILFVMRSTSVYNMTFNGFFSFINIVQNSFDVPLVVDITNIFVESVHIEYGSLINISGLIYSNDINVGKLTIANVNKNILTADNVAYGSFNIQQINVSTTTMLNHTKSENMFLFNIMHSNVNITNVNINYIIIKELINHCERGFYMSGNCMGNKMMIGFNISDALGFVGNFTPHIKYHCDSPVSFINITKSTVNMKQIMIYNDITKSGLSHVKNKLFQQYKFGCNINISTSADIYYDVTPTGLINSENSQLFIKNVHLHGVGFHEKLMRIRNDELETNYVTVSHLYIHYNTYCGQVSSVQCHFDPYALNMHGVIYHYGEGHGSFSISDSFLYGIKSVFLVDNGNNYIINVTVQYAETVITAFNRAKSLHIFNSSFSFVGGYYTRTVFDTEFLSTQAESSISLHSTPFDLQAQFIWIENNRINAVTGIAGHFLFDPEFGTDFAHSTWYSPSIVVLYNNIFETDLNLKDYQNPPSAFYSRGAINVAHDVKMYVIQNNITDLNGDKSLFYFNIRNTVCFSRNILTGSMIVEIDAGFMTSCDASAVWNMIHNKNNCFYVSIPKPMMFELEPDIKTVGIWTSTSEILPMIRASDGVSVMVQNVMFAHKEFVNDQTIIFMNMGEFIFMDTILESGVSNFRYNFMRCNVSCFDILNPSLHTYFDRKYISQLHVNCNSNNSAFHSNWLSFNASSLINHSTPYYIRFKYNNLYKVGENLKIIFTIKDQFRNTIADYSAPISFTFIEEEFGSDQMTVISNMSSVILLKPNVTNSRTFKNVSIVAIVNNGSLHTENTIELVVFPMSDAEPFILLIIMLIVLFFVLLIPCTIWTGFCMYFRNQYNDAFVIDNALVFIIGIAKFDQQNLKLNGVSTCVNSLQQLWHNTYGYDVYPLNDNELYWTKQDIIDFIDKYKLKLNNVNYKAFIMHIITHGDVDSSFLTSDLKHMKTSEFIQHEISEELESCGNTEAIKVIFHHCCRGTANYNVCNSTTRPIDTSQIGQYMSINSYETEETNEIKEIEMEPLSSVNIQNNMENKDDNKEKQTMATESNWVTIFGQSKGRAISDSGTFTQCVCDTFEKNATRTIKKNFKSLYLEIGQNLETKSNKAELCTSEGLMSIRYHHVRFEPCK
eukprot:506598_1